jgi:hypothetical protein
MKRTIGAFFAGVIAWLVIVSLLNRVLRLTIDGYAAAEPTLVFTLGMMVGRLSIAALTSLAAGAIMRWIAPASIAPAWALGILLLVVFVPEHIKLWNMFPAWYHLAFLVPLVPLLLIGSLLGRRRLSGSEIPAPQVRNVAG